MNKTKLRNEIRDYLVENNAFMVFNVCEKDGNTFHFEPVSLDEWLGISKPAVYEEKIYPTRISAGLIKAINYDREFLAEIFKINTRFLNGDWGDDLDDYKDTIEYNDQYPERAQGYYNTSWGEVSIKRDNTFTTAFFPFER